MACFEKCFEANEYFFSAPQQDPQRKEGGKKLCAFIICPVCVNIFCERQTAKGNMTTRRRILSSIGRDFSLEETSPVETSCSSDS